VEPGGLERGQVPPFNSQNFFLKADKIFFDTLVAHHKPTTRGIDITSSRQRFIVSICRFFYYFRLLVSEFEEIQV
jgi:hypothetical protein